VRIQVWILAIGAALALAMPASAQLGVSGGARTTALPSGSSFFSAPFAKPDFSGMSIRPMMPTPLNFGAMMPSWSHFQNAMLMRNVFTGPQAVIQIPFLPKQPAQPAPEKTRPSSSIFFP